MADIKICIRHSGEARRTVNDEWKPVTCFVSHASDDDHRTTVEDDFRYHLGLDLEYMYARHADHFLDSMNVSRAILRRKYFAPNHTFFEWSNAEYIRQDELPQRRPDATATGFEIWVDQSGDG